MTPDEARNILGLQPEDDPHQHFAEFNDARERIAEMVRRAPNQVLALRYQDGLNEFDRALAVIREDLEAKAKAALALSWKPVPVEDPPAPDVSIPAGPPPLKHQSEVTSPVAASRPAPVAVEVESKAPPAVVVVGSKPQILPETVAPKTPIRFIPLSQSPPVLPGASEEPAADAEKIEPPLIPVAGGRVKPPPLPEAIVPPPVTVGKESPPPALPAASDVPPTLVSPPTPAIAEPKTPEVSVPVVPVVAAADAAVAEVAAFSAHRFTPSVSSETPAEAPPEIVPVPEAVVPEPLSPETPVPEEPRVALPPPLPPAVGISVPSISEIEESPPEPPVSTAPALPPTLPPVVGAAAIFGGNFEPALPAPPVENPSGITAASIFSDKVEPPVPAADEPSSAPVETSAAEVSSVSQPPFPEVAAETISSPDETLPIPPTAAPEPAAPVIEEAVADPSAKKPFQPVFPPFLRDKFPPQETTESAEPDAVVPESSAARPPLVPWPTDSTPVAKAIPSLSPEDPLPDAPVKTVKMESVEPPAVASAAVVSAEPVKPGTVSDKQPEKFEEEKERHPGRILAYAAILFLVVAGGGAGWWMYTEREALARTERLTFLETLGAKMVEVRQWPEARDAYDEMERLAGPGNQTYTEIAQKGRHSIEAGMEDEQTQFVGYWSGEALAAFEAGRWEDAEDAAHKVLERYPDETETAALLAKIEQAKITKIIEDLKKAARDGIQHRQWDAAEASAKELVAKFPDDSEASSLLKEIRDDREKEIHNKARAEELFAAASLKDQGRFDSQAMDWLREATALAPEDKAIAALYEKMASYTRSVRVPGDFPDLRKAIQACGDRDRIVLGEGTWSGPLVIGKAISLEGAGPDKTFIEVDAKESAAATFGPGSKGARITGITFRQTSFDNGTSRFPALLVRGGELNASDCHFEDASGHGVAVIDGGAFTAKRCVFQNNGWDGVSAQGSGSRLVLEECEATSNFGHGYDAWDGAAVSIHTSHASQNSRNGILVDTTAKEVSLEENDLRANREFGLVVNSGASGKISANVCRENLLGGLVMRAAAGQLVVENNRSEKNVGPGLVLEQGLPPAKYSTNAATANGGGRDTMANVDFSSAH
jgi:tetratricopeptide (TPR) repeat protein